jgi:uncharacterized protein (DUF362 family)
MSKKKQNRREFLLNISRLAVGSAGFSLLASSRALGAAQREGSKPQQAPPKTRSQVVIARDPKLVINDKPDKRLTTELLNKAVIKLVRAKDAPTAWGALFSNKDVVGIKVNSLGGKGLSPHPELLDAIVQGLLSAGVPENSIIIWDRFDRELAAVGYTLNRSAQGVRCFGTEQDFEEDITIMGEVGSCLSKIFTSLCTAIINVPILKDHDLAGVSGSMKNLYGIIHNPNRYHDNSCDPYVAEISAFPAVRQKIRLIICDAIRPQYHAGPAFRPQFQWNYGGLLVSTDPVAHDRIAADIIEEKRKEKGMSSLAEAGRPPKWIDTAAAMGVGIADPRRIEVIRV